MKLRLEELAPYLPYGLRGELRNPEYYPTTIGQLFRLETSADSDNIPYCIVDVYEDEIEYFKPILRPLSDLGEVIDHKGEKFVPVEWLEDKFYTLDLHNQCKRVMEDERWVNHCEYILVQYLLRWHFDIFGLIDKGLAININLLDDNNGINGES